MDELLGPVVLVSAALRLIRERIAGPADRGTGRQRAGTSTGIDAGCKYCQAAVAGWFPARIPAVLIYLPGCFLACLLACFCEDFFWFAFGDLSPMILVG